MHSMQVALFLASFTRVKMCDCPISALCRPRLASHSMIPPTSSSCSHSLRGPLTSGSGLCYQRVLMITRWLSGSSPGDEVSHLVPMCAEQLPACRALSSQVLAALPSSRAPGRSLDVSSCKMNAPPGIPCQLPCSPHYSNTWMTKVFLTARADLRNTTVNAYLLL